MRVRGSKRRVRLTEADLEPSDQKPMLRIAPAAASLIWLGSIALATAIYMEWLPARALFENGTPGPPARAADEFAGNGPALSSRPPALKTGLSRRATPAPAGVRAPEVPPGTLQPVASARQAERPPHTAITTPVVVPESTRTIRGSYYSDDSNWAAGW